jgi:predicted O-methyltransferase YrrM
MINETFRHWQHQEFLDLMLCLVKLYAPAIYVEIGAQKGYTFNQIAPLISKKAVAVDINPMPAVLEETGKIKKWQMSSDIAANHWDPQDEIDLLFIDANHEKSSVLHDFDRWSPYVRKYYGLILLHDTHPMRDYLLSERFCHNAWQAARDIRFEPKYRESFEIMTCPGPFAGISLIRKSDRQHLGWKRGV